VEIGQSRHFSKGVSQFEHNFQREGTSCGIKISAVHHLDLSRSMRDRQTDRQNYTSQDRPCAVKTIQCWAIISRY